jgi:hypothetical protein
MSLSSQLACTRVCRAKPPSNDKLAPNIKTMGITTRHGKIAIVFCTLRIFWLIP